MEERNRVGAEELARLRTDLHLSTIDLAAMAGVTEADWLEMEAGRRPVPPELFAELMEELNAKGA